MLALASLGPSTANELEEKKEEEEVLPHFIVPVDLRKGKKSNHFLPHSMLIDSGTSYSFVSQAVADSV